MSDSTKDIKPSGYRIEYSISARAGCKGPKPCKGTSIPKGELRLGSLVSVKGHASFSWRHWGCVTPKLISNMKKSVDEVDELDGFEDLQKTDQARLRRAWDEGHVAEEDVPSSARKPKDADDASLAEQSSNGGDDKPERTSPRRKTTPAKKTPSSKKSKLNAAMGAEKKKVAVAE